MTVRMVELVIRFAGARPVFSATSMMATVAVLALLPLQLTPAPATVQTETCDGATVVIEGDDPSPFILPAGEGATLRVEPDSLLRVSAEDTRDPPARRQVQLSIVGFGFTLDAITRDVGTGPDSDPIEMDLGELSCPLSHGGHTRLRDR